MFSFSSRQRISTSHLVGNTTSQARHKLDQLTIDCCLLPTLATPRFIHIFASHNPTQNAASNPGPAICTHIRQPVSCTYPILTSLCSISISPLALTAQFALEYMPMSSLLAWRATCRDNYLLVTQRLRRLLYSMLAGFFPDPHRFIHTLTRWGGLIVGEAALCLILNYSSLPTGVTLELAVGNLVFDKFVEHITHLIPFGSHLVNCIDKPSPPSFPTLRHISRIAEFYLTSGQIVHIYESSTPSACDVVCGAWTTALMNFVTASSIGCAYPRLTLNFCGVLCDGRTNAKRWIDNGTYDRLRKLGFRFTAYGPTWPSFSTSPYSLSLPSSVGCGKLLHVCPSQARYFGDPGSLVVFFDGFFVDLGELRDLSIAPYGVMTAWRIPTNGICEGRCIEDESVLPAFVITMIIQFFEDQPSFVPFHTYSWSPTSLKNQSSSMPNTLPTPNISTRRTRSLSL